MQDARARMRWSSLRTSAPASASRQSALLDRRTSETDAMKWTRCKGEDEEGESLRK